MNSKERNFPFHSDNILFDLNEQVNTKAHIIEPEKCRILMQFFYMG